MLTYRLANVIFTYAELKPTLVVRLEQLFD